MQYIYYSWFGLFEINSRKKCVFVSTIDPHRSIWFIALKISVDFTRVTKTIDIFGYHLDDWAALSSLSNDFHFLVAIKFSINVKTVIFSINSYSFNLSIVVLVCYGAFSSVFGKFLIFVCYFIIQINWNVLMINYYLKITHFISYNLAHVLTTSKVTLYGFIYDLLSALFCLMWIRKFDIHSSIIIWLRPKGIREFIACLKSISAYNNWALFFEGGNGNERRFFVWIRKKAGKMPSTDHLI